MKKFKSILSAFIAALFITSLGGTMVYAKEKEEEKSSKNEIECSLYFDNDQSYSFLHTSSQYLSPQLGVKGATGQSLTIAGNYDASKGAVLTSDVIYFNSSDFGLENFADCEIQASFINNISPSIAEIEFFTDGASFISQTIPAGDSFKEYTLNNGSEPNTMMGLYVKFKESYSGEICSIDNLIIKAPDGTIATINGVEDKVEYKSKSPVLYIIIIIILVGIIAYGIYYSVRKAINQFR